MHLNIRNKFPYENERKNKKIGLLAVEIGLYAYPNRRLSYPALVCVGTGDGSDEARLK
jgi:hypothetical protein